MTDSFIPRPRFCRCKAERVDTSDIVHANRLSVIVHGLHHCFSYARAVAA